MFHILGGVFIVIFVGIGLACITLAFEYWWYKYKNNPRVTIFRRKISTQKENAAEKIHPTSLADFTGLKSRTGFQQQSFQYVILFV